MDMSKNIKNIVKNNLNSLLETKGFEHMEVAFGVKEKSDNLSDAEKKQFGEWETIQDEEGVKLGDASVQPALNKVHKEDEKDADTYYKEVDKKMKDFQTTSESKPSQIGEVKIKKQNLSEGAFWDRLKYKFFDLKIALKSIGVSVKEIPNLYRLLKSGDQEGYEKALKELEIKLNRISFSHPSNDTVRELLKAAIKSLRELDDLTYSYFEKDPSKFSKHQQDILLGNMKITDDGLTRDTDLYNIDESFTPPKVNREDDQTEPDEVYSTEALGPGMLALKYDNEGTPVHKKFEERMEDMNGDDLTYKKLRAYSEKYLKHKYEKPSEYHKTPKVRVTNESISMDDEKERAWKKFQKDKHVTSKTIKVARRDFEKEYTKKDSVDGTKKSTYNEGKEIIKTKQNGDKSYSVEYSDGTKNKIHVSHDDWDEIHDKYGEIKEYSDVLKENIFKVKNTIKSKEQVLKLVSKLPKRVRVDETEFAVTDGENYYKLIWEGIEDGEAVIINEMNRKVVNEDISKMKHLWGFKSSDSISTKKNIKEGNEDVFFKMMNKVRKK